MTTTQLKAAIATATAEIERIDISRGNSRFYVAVYADGTISPILNQHTWEGGKPAVVCQVQPWYDSASSKTANLTAHRAEKGRALAEAESTLTEPAAC